MTKSTQEHLPECNTEMVMARTQSRALQLPSCNTISCILFSSITCNLSLSPKQSISKTKHHSTSISLVCTLPIWQQTNSQFRAPVHTLVQESKLSGHLVSLTESFTHPWPSLAYCSPTSIH